MASLRPRRYPTEPKPFEALLDKVLDRLGGWFELFEYVEEPLDAVEYCRRGDGDVVACPNRVRGE